MLAKPPLIKVGIIAPLSGPISDYGIYCLQGIKLAFMNHPEIKLIVRDNEGKVENVPLILREFAEERISAVIGPIISPNAVIAGLETNNLGIPIVLPAATNTAVTKVSNYLFRACYTDEQQAEALARFVYQKLNKREVRIITDTSNIYSSGLALYFKYYFQNMGGNSYLIEWDGVSDITEIIQGLNGSTIFLPLYYKPAENIIKKARENGLDIVFVGADGLDAPELFKALEYDTEKIYFSTHYFGGVVPESLLQYFTDSYEKAYGREPNTFSALGFDAGNLFLVAIERAKGVSSKDILNALSNIDSFQGVTGSFQYDGKRDPVKNIFILQLQKGKLSLVQKL